ncbi:HAD domain-containing protein [Delftia tsuruhatensis]|uniref:HAD domain-containing protein n=1 Tax=Delftia tsuruhatensis TaxID=180282 RepID=UPI002091248E|nr:HAD domain-containing protein [Delftia tsuruhatensis]MCO5338601.1 HAD domain-containing protein [Delftia tsuruhatensis]MCR4546615.1 HAD domain-containing protein [Delftia tsuruhatensis]
MRVLFLDIDGVLNSTRTCVAHGGFPHELTHTEAFDWVAIKLLQRLCDSSGIQVVLSSAWRLTHNFKDVAKAFDLPIIDRTPSLGDAWRYYASLRVAKQRGGATGDLNLRYVGHLVRFENWNGDKPSTTPGRSADFE